MKKIILFFIVMLFFSLGNLNAFKYENDLIYREITNEKVLYLTFDDGYYDNNTNKILDILKEKNVKASFFYAGDFMLGFEKTLKRTEEEGHLIGNHTFTHTTIDNLSSKELDNELKRAEDAYYYVTNKPLKKYFRPPQGFINENNIMELKKLKYTTVMWNVNYLDYNRDKDPGFDYAYNYLINNVEEGNIILLHTMSNTNVKVLPLYIDYCLKKGYIFKTVDQISK